MGSSTTSQQSWSPKTTGSSVLSLHTGVTLRYLCVPLQYVPMPRCSTCPVAVRVSRGSTCVPLQYVCHVAVPVCHVVVPVCLVTMHVRDCAFIHDWGHKNTASKCFNIASKSFRRCSPMLSFLLEFCDPANGSTRSLSKPARLSH